jgi:hypothetical protein
MKTRSTILSKSAYANVFFWDHRGRGLDPRVQIAFVFPGILYEQPGELFGGLASDG